MEIPRWSPTPCMLQGPTRLQSRLDDKLVIRAYGMTSVTFKESLNSHQINAVATGAGEPVRMAIGEGQDVVSATLQAADARLAGLRLKNITKLQSDVQRVRQKLFPCKSLKQLLKVRLMKKAPSHADGATGPR